MAKIRSRQCMFVLYPESQQDLIEWCQKNLPCAWALHDKDTWKTDAKDGSHKAGDLKKPHVHFVCKFANARYFSGIAKEIGIPENAIERVNNLYKAYTYLWHDGHPDKYQYDPSIVGVHEFDIPSEHEGMSADEDEQVKTFLNEFPNVQCVEQLANWAYENGCWKVFRDNYHLWKDILHDRLKVENVYWSGEDASANDGYQKPGFGIEVTPPSGITL